MGNSTSSEGENDLDPWERIEASLDGDERLNSELTRMAVEASLPEGTHVVRSQSSSWLETGVEGVRCKVLAGPGSGQPPREGGGPARRVLLLSMEPGAVYPGHDHPEVEETYMLSGDLRVGELILRAGDFQSLPGGSAHAPQTTESGCLCLVICSPRQVR